MHPQPDNDSNFVIELTPPLYQRIKEELGDAFLDNYKLHYSPYWKEMKEPEVEP